MKHMKQQQKSAKKAKRKHRKALETMKVQAAQVEKRLEFEKDDDPKSSKKKTTMHEKSEKKTKEIDDERFDKEEVPFVEPPKQKTEHKVIKSIDPETQIQQSSKHSQTKLKQQMMIPKMKKIKNG